MGSRERSSRSADGRRSFADAHRASGDCCTLLHILPSPFGAEGRSALATLLANGRQATIRIFAVDSPFDRKDLLKTRGYRCSNGTNRLRRFWWRDVAERDLESEFAFPRASVFLRPVDLPTQRVTSRERYSTNAPS
jgi:DNA polymerase-3 subunit epsilon